MLMTDQYSKFYNIHQSYNYYAYCLYNNCNREKRWLCVQCYLKKTHDHMDYVVTEYQFVKKIEYSLEYFKQSRIYEITNIIQQLQSEEINLNNIIHKLKPICDDTRETYQQLQQFEINDLADPFQLNNNEMEILRHFVQNNQKWSNYFQMIKESIFSYTQHFYSSNSLMKSLNILLRSPDQFYFKSKSLFSQVDPKQLIISPNQYFLAAVSGKRFRLSNKSKLIRKKSICNYEHINITFNPESTQICAGFRNGDIILFNILDLSFVLYPQVVPDFIEEIVYCAQNQIFILTPLQIVKYDILNKITLFSIQGCNLKMQYNKCKGLLITYEKEFIYYRDSETGYIMNSEYKDDIDDDYSLQYLKFIENQDVIVTKLNNGMLKTYKCPKKSDIFHNQKQFQHKYMNDLYKVMDALNQNVLILVWSHKIILLYSCNLAEIKTIKQTNEFRNYSYRYQVQPDGLTVIIENIEGKYRLLKIK